MTGNANEFHVNPPHLCTEIADGLDNWWAEYRDAAQGYGSRNGRDAQSARRRSRNSPVGETDAP